jgi:hypothetical protein
MHNPHATQAPCCHLRLFLHNVQQVMLLLPTAILHVESICVTSTMLRMAAEASPCGNTNSQTSKGAYSIFMIKCKSADVNKQSSNFLSRDSVDLVPPSYDASSGMVLNKEFQRKKKKKNRLRSPQEHKVQRYEGRLKTKPLKSRSGNRLEKGTARGWVVDGDLVACMHIPECATKTRPLLTACTLGAWH